eukprot:scaffold21698_cov122-Isochrysis_galbana.AAC.6
MFATVHRARRRFVSSQFFIQFMYNLRFDTPSRPRAPAPSGPPYVIHASIREPLARTRATPTPSVQLEMKFV